jgi:hypothetical protein
MDIVRGYSSVLDTHGDAVLLESVGGSRRRRRFTKMNRIFS